MHANRNSLDHIRHLAKMVGVSRNELLHMARVADHSELMPSIEHLSAEGATRLRADLEQIPKDRRWIREVLATI